MRISVSKSNLALYTLLLLSLLFFAFQALGTNIEGLFFFNPSAGTVPFQVDATKTGKVDNLNADRVDDLHAADLMAAGGGGCYELFGSNTCATGFTRVVDGVATLYYESISGAGGVVCSPPHITSPATFVGFVAISESNKVTAIANESCAICCK